MNAEQMFKANNEWKREESKDMIAYTLDQPTWGNGGAHFGVVFHTDTKSYHTYVFFNNRRMIDSCMTDGNMSIPLPIHAAITQQMKELGWIE